jgi:phosphatidylglycerophosphate synthase
MIITTTATLGIAGALPVPLVALILVRDLTLIQGACWHRYRSLPVKSIRAFFTISSTGMEVVASRLSKTNTLLQVTLIASVLVLNAASPLGLSDVHVAQSWLGLYMVPIVAITTWTSGLRYYFRNPFDALPTFGVISPTATRIAASVNATMLFGGFLLLVLTVRDASALKNQDDSNNNSETKH